jgi:hypothetical protein
MITKAQAILDEIRALPPTEHQKASHFILEHLFLAPPVLRRRTISDIAGKYRTSPDPEATNHDCGFAEASA